MPHIVPQWFSYSSFLQTHDSDIQRIRETDRHPDSNNHAIMMSNKSRNGRDTTQQTDLELQITHHWLLKCLFEILYWIPISVHLVSWPSQYSLIDPVTLLLPDSSVYGGQVSCSVVPLIVTLHPISSLISFRRQECFVIYTAMDISTRAISRENCNNGYRCCLVLMSPVLSCNMNEYGYG